MYQPKTQPDIRCPLEYGLKIFGGKWKSRILCILAREQTLRYSALRKELTNVTDAVLAATLKELQADQMIARQLFDEIPPRVEYSLTPRGHSVIPILKHISDWAGAFCNEEAACDVSGCQMCDYRGHCTEENPTACMR